MRHRGFSSHPLIGFALTLGLLLGGARVGECAAPKASLKGPSSIPAGGTLVLDARASVSDKPLVWKVKGPDLALLPADSAGRQGVLALAFNVPQGTYHIILIAKGKPTDTADLDADVDELDVVVGGAPPVPPPDPHKPDPPYVPVPDPTNPMSAAAISYSAAIRSAYADSWDAAATALSQGQTVTQALTAGSQTLAAKRNDAMAKILTPELAKVLPEGQEPTDPALRSAVVTAWKQLAAAIRGGR